MKTIFILADSTNRRFLQMYGSKHPAYTPNLDRLAERGTVFEQHWCGSAPCMPARRDIMTGRLNFLEKPWGGSSRLIRRCQHFCVRKMSLPTW